MVPFLLGKLLRAASVLVAVSLLTFLVGHASGDPVLLMVRGDATPAQKAEMRSFLGLDQPLSTQYLRYAGAALHGDLGTSYRQHRAVSSLILQRLPYTLALAGAAFLLALLGGAAAGAEAAWTRGRWPDHLLTALSTLAQVLPGFWIGLMLVLLFAVHWHWLPVSGADQAGAFLLPLITLAIPTLGRTALLARGSLLDVLGADFIRTARAKGLSERDVLLGHAARNAVLPLIAQAGLELGDMVGSAFIVETVFAWPGVGRLAVNAVLQRDFPVVQGCVLVTAATFITVNLAVDLLCAWADPRIRDR